MSERHRDRGRHRRHTRSASQPVFAVGAMAAAFVPLVQSAGSGSPASTPTAMDVTAAHSTVLAAPASAPTPEMVSAATQLLKAQADSTPQLRASSAPAQSTSTVLGSDQRASRSTQRAAAPAATGAKAPTVTTPAKSSTKPAPKAGIKGTAMLPVHADYVITGVFNEYRADGVRAYNHKGLDFAVPTGTRIYAVQAGTVVYAQWNSGGYGYRIVVKHASGDYSTYNHLSQIKVSVGEKVAMDEVIGLSGNTGDSQGPHLHFEINQGNDPLDQNGYVNPALWLTNRGIKNV
jgi:murein DD-endopeptidase MepM/ murein hydrolase activator NlpD